MRALKRRGRGGAGVTALVALSITATAPSAAAAPTPLADFGSNGAAAGQIVNPFGLAFDSAGNLYVSERNNNRISAFRPDGTFVRAFGYDVALPPAVGAPGFEVCTTMTGCKAGVGGGNSGQFSSPYGIAMDGSDRLYVADGNARISVFNVAGGASSFSHAFGRDVNEPADPEVPDFEVCTTTCRPGEGFMGFTAGELSFARDVAFDAGSLYVLEQSGLRISVFDAPGAPGTVSFSRAIGAGVDSGNQNDLEACTAASSCGAGQPATGGDELVQLMSPESLEVRSGIAYVADTANNRISVYGVAGPSTVHTFGWDTEAFAGSGELESCIGPGIGGCQAGVAGGGDGQMNSPRGVALDRAGSLQVADTVNRRVSVFGSPAVAGSASFVHAYGFDVATPADPMGGVFEVCTLDPGAGQGCVAGDGGTGGFGQLDQGTSIEVDCRGGVWVGDTNHGEVKRYGEPGTALPPCPAAAESGSGSGTGTAVPPPQCGGKAATIVGTEGKDSLTGTLGPDVIAALGDRDKANGRGGNDVICGGAGKDRLIGGSGKDRLFGNGGKDRLFGNGGKDRLFGNGGKDSCKGGPLKDRARSCEVKRSI